MCTVFHRLPARWPKKINEARGPFSRFLGLLAHFEVEVHRNFGTGMCGRTAGFHHVLSVFVVPSVSVESAMESNDVLNDVFVSLCL